MTDFWNVPKMWLGSTVFIIGGGNSLNTSGLKWTSDTKEQILDKISSDLKPIWDERSIGVNDAFLLGDWIDISWFGDSRWFEWNKNKLSQFPGLKACCCPHMVKKSKEIGVKVLQRGKSLGLDPNSCRVSWNHTSGSSAISLAANLGARKIVLLGFDMHISNQVDHNWHENHKVQLKDKNDPYPRFLNAFEQIAEDAEKRGIEIINCSMNSTIKQFPKITFKEVIKSL